MTVSTQRQLTMTDIQEVLEEFSVEDTETVIKSAIGSVLTNADYKPAKINDWSNSIISAALNGLQSLNRPYKYAITVILMQKVRWNGCVYKVTWPQIVLTVWFFYLFPYKMLMQNGAGLVSAASTYWDASRDGLCKVMWENGTMHCVVTVYGTSVNIETKDDEKLDVAVAGAGS